MTTHRIRMLSGFAITAVTLILALFVEFDPRLDALLALLALAVLVVLFSVPEKSEKRLLYFVIAIISLNIFVIGSKDDVERLADGKVRIWNVYHYYLGSKYFDELGYTDLYVATLTADREGSKRWVGVVKEVRDLNSYQRVDIETAMSRYNPETHFSAARWTEFKADVEHLGTHRRAKNWRSIFVDRGYNPPPVWTAVGGQLSALAPASPAGLAWLASIDILLLFGAFAMLVRTFGVRWALLVGLLFVVSPANVPRAIGGFLQFDWLFSIVLAVCMMQREKVLLAGVVISYAVMTRVFPVILVSAFFVPALFVLASRKTLSRDAIHFLVGFCLGCFTLFAFSLLAGGGVQAWQAFFEAIFVHNGDHALGERRIGLEHLFTATPELFSHAIDKAQRATLISERQIAYSLSAVLIIILYIAAAIRMKPLQALLSALSVVFALLVLSRYYYGVLALMPLMATTERGAVAITAGQVLLFSVAHILRSVGVEWHSLYVVINILLAFYFLTILICAAWQSKKNKPAKSGKEHAHLRYSGQSDEIYS